MTPHPDTDRLTAWVHDLLETAEAREIGAHAASCPECRELAGLLREEAAVLAGAIAPEGRLARLKERLLSPPATRRSRGLLWQIPVAAAVLIGLLVGLFPSGPRHRLEEGRLALEDGREVAAPVDLAGAKSWRLRAVDRARLRLSDRSTLDLEPGSRIGLEPLGERGVQAQLGSGELRVAVAPDARRLTVCSPSGRVECAEGVFSVKILNSDRGGTSMNTFVAGALVTLLSGTASVANAQGSAALAPGASTLLARAEAPLAVSTPQDAETLLRRLEELSARVAKLEEEIGRLEARNKQLKDQLKSPGPAFWSNGAGGLRVQTTGTNPGGSVIIVEEDPNRKDEKKGK